MEVYLQRCPNLHRGAFMKKLTILIACLTVITTLVACNNETTTERTAPTNSTTQMITGAVSVTGKVTEIYGNELVLLLAEGSNTSTARPSGDAATGRGEISELSEEDRTAMRENMTGEAMERPNMVEGEMSELSDEDKVALRENMGTQGGRGQQAIVEVEENLEDIEDEDEVTTSSYTPTNTSSIKSMSIGLSNMLILNGGGPSGDRWSSMTDSDREAMMSQMGGDRTSATSGNTSTSIEDIVLTQETKDYTIPVGTPVYSYGTALSFSQISKDAYITIYMNNDGNIVSVNILG